MKRTYALRLEHGNFKGRYAEFEDMASLERVVRQRQDVPSSGQLFWQDSKEAQLPMEWNNNQALPQLPWITVRIPHHGMLIVQHVRHANLLD